MTTSTRVRKPRSTRRRDERPFVVAFGGLLTLVILGLLAYVMGRSPEGVPFVSYKTLYAQVPDPGNLEQHDEVRIAGVRVGQVLDVTRNRGRSVIKLQMRRGTAPVPADTTVLVRGQGLLGQRYVELRPGRSPRTLPWGSTIVGGAGSLTYGVPDALETFDKETRGALGQTMTQFGQGLLGRGAELNTAIHVTPQGARDFRALADAVLARTGSATRFVPSLDGSARAFDAARSDLTAMMSPVTRGLAPFVDDRTSVRNMLQTAPSTLTAVQSGLDQGRELLGAAHGLASSVADVLPAAPAGLRAATALLRESPRPLARATGLLKAVRPAVPHVLRITDRLDPNLTPLRRLFDDANRLVVPIVPRMCDVENFAENFRSVIGQADGPGGPAGPLGNFRAFAIILGAEAAGPFVHFPDAIEQGYGYEPYPAPCKYSPGSVYRLSPLPTTGSR